MMQKKLELSRNAESASKNDPEENELVRLRAELKRLIETVENLENEKKEMQSDYEAKMMEMIEKNKNNSFERYKQTFWEEVVMAKYIL
jgi:flagellar biosynthesis/type III secretory pathway protein FliH